MNMPAPAHLSACLNRLRAFMGLLMNHEDILESSGVNLAHAYQFAVEEHDLLELWQSRPLSDAPEEVLPQILDAEQILLQKVSSILAILKVHHSNSQALGVWLSFREQLRQAAQQDPALFAQAPGPLQISAPANLSGGDPLQPYHVSWPDLQRLRSSLMALQPAHDFILPFGLFLGGMGQFYAQQKHAAHHPSGCPLSLAAQNGLQTAVEFALQEEAQCLARSRSRIPGDTEYQCLVMGVAYLAQNPAPSLEPWIRLGPRSRQLASAFFAMGCLATSERVSFRWTRLLLPRWQMLTEDSFSPEMTRVILRWIQRIKPPA